MKKELVIFAVKTVISLSVGTVVSTVVGSATPVILTSLEKVGLKIGVFAISSVVGDVVADKLVSQVEELTKIDFTKLAV